MSLVTWVVLPVTCTCLHLGSSDWTPARLQPETWIHHYQDDFLWLHHPPWTSTELHTYEHLKFFCCEGKGNTGMLTSVRAVNEVLYGCMTYDNSSAASRNMTLLNDALNKCIEQAGCMARWCDGLTSDALRNMCQALADRKEADLEELENRDYEKSMPAWL